MLSIPRNAKPPWHRKKLLPQASCHSHKSYTISSNSEISLRPVIKHQNQGTTHTAQNVCCKSFVQTCNQSLFCSNFLEAVHCAFVEVLFGRLLTLHLEASSHGVKGVCGTSTDCDGRLCGSEGADCTNDALVLFPWVQTCNCVKGSQLQSTVANNTNHRNTKSCVECKEPTRPCSSFFNAVAQACEAFLSRANVRGQTCPCIIKRVDNRQAAGSSQSPRDKVCTKKLQEFRLRIVFWEHFLEGVFESEVECLRGEVTDAVGEIAVPKPLHALFFENARTTVHNARVARHLPTPDLGVGILCLHNQLYALDWCCDGLCNSARKASQGEVYEKGRGVIFCHGVLSASYPRGF